MFVRVALPSFVVAVLYLATANGDSSGNECAKANTAKAETYLETAAALIEKLRENLPEAAGLTGGDCSCSPTPIDCEQVLRCGHNRSGVYEVWPMNRVIFGSVRVFCDMETNGGGWTVIQRRGDYKRPVDFFQKSWHKYKTGFGDLRRDFWLGNDNIYALTNQKRYYLRVELTDFENNTRYASYDQFWIDSENQNYKLHVHDYSGDAGDAFAKVHSGHDFSTVDRDNDNSTEHCAEKNEGGWWYASCHASNLNGLYLGPKVKNPKGVVWSTWKAESLKITEMKLRPMDFKTDLLELDVDLA